MFILFYIVRNFLTVETQIGSDLFSNKKPRLTMIILDESQDKAMYLGICKIKVPRVELFSLSKG